MSVVDNRRRRTAHATREDAYTEILRRFDEGAAAKQVTQLPERDRVAIVQETLLDIFGSRSSKPMEVLRQAEAFGAYSESTQRMTRVTARVLSEERTDDELAAQGMVDNGTKAAER
jgi:hypothetical protein